MTHAYSIYRCCECKEECETYTESELQTEEGNGMRQPVERIVRVSKCCNAPTEYIYPAECNTCHLWVYPWQLDAEHGLCASCWQRDSELRGTEFVPCEVVL